MNLIILNLKNRVHNNKLILRSGIIKRIINIEINKSYARIVFLRQSMKNIYIDDEISKIEEDSLKLRLLYDLRTILENSSSSEEFKRIRNIK